MVQDERWLKRYQDVMEFMDKNPRNPSRPRIEEPAMLNRRMENRKKMNAGELRSERIEAFNRLLEMIEQYKRKNQYQ